MSDKRDSPEMCILRAGDQVERSYLAFSSLGELKV